MLDFRLDTAVTRTLLFKVCSWPNSNLNLKFKSQIEFKYFKFLKYLKGLLQIFLCYKEYKPWVAMSPSSSYSPSLSSFTITRASGPVHIPILLHKLNKNIDWSTKLSYKNKTCLRQVFLNAAYKFEFYITYAVALWDRTREYICIHLSVFHSLELFAMNSLL